MPPSLESSSNAAQIDYWNAIAGETWAQYQAHRDGLIEPLGVESLRTLAPRTGERIVDIGCGCGQTSLDLAARAGPNGWVLGVDISLPMLAVAPQSALWLPSHRPADFARLRPGDRQGRGAPDSCEPPFPQAWRRRSVVALYHC